jgi:hypothetical protein
MPTPRYRLMKRVNRLRADHITRKLPEDQSLSCRQVSGTAEPPPNGTRLSCGALIKDSFPNLRAPPASSAC